MVLGYVGTGFYFVVSAVGTRGYLHKDRANLKKAGVKPVQRERFVCVTKTSKLSIANEILPM